MLRVLLVRDLNHQQVPRRFPVSLSAIEARTVQSQKLALPAQGRIVIKPGAKTSTQMHYHRAEHWIVVKDTAKETIEDKTLMLAEKVSTFIPICKTHALENHGIIPLEIIEVQSGSYLGEDDIVRVEDRFGRLSE